MTDLNIHSEKRTDAQERAAEYVADNPVYIGVDAEGDWHFWSRHDRQVIVVSDDEVGLCDLYVKEEPLGDWYIHTRDERGWADCNIDTPRREIPA